MKLKLLFLVAICLLGYSGKLLARPRAGSTNSSLGFQSNCRDGASPDNTSCPLVLFESQAVYSSSNSVTGYSGTHFTVTFTSSTWCDEDPTANYPSEKRCGSGKVFEILEVSISGVDPSIATLNLRSLVINQVQADANYVFCDPDESGGISQCAQNIGVSDVTAYANVTQTRFDLDSTALQGCLTDCVVIATAQTFDVQLASNFQLVADDGNGHVFAAGTLPQTDYAAAGNDQTESAYVVSNSNLPAVYPENVANATSAVTDPSSAPSCVDPDYVYTNTVWFEFTPTVATLLQLDTSGSNYDTFIAVYNGTPGQSTEIGCNQDISDTQYQSFLTVETDPQTGSAPYYVLVGEQGLSWDPNLHFTMSAPPLLTASEPAITLAIAFGSTTSKTFNITAHNSAVTNIQLSTDNSQFNASDNCPSTLGVGSSCLVTVGFTPTQVHSTGVLTVSWGSTGQSLQIGIVGSGTGPLATFDTSSPSLTFPRQFIGTKSAMLPVCSGCPGAFIVGDADGDGKLDVITGSTQGTITVYFGDGAGGFTRNSTVTGCTTTANMYTAPYLVTDLNDDQKPDIVLMCSPGSGGTTYASVLLGTGNGNFGAPKPASAYACWSGSIQAVDVDHNGVPDLVTGCPGYNSGEIDISTGNGDGTFNSPTPLYACADQVLFTDFDLDGYPDVVAVCSSTGSIDVFMNDETGNYPVDLSLVAGPSSPPDNYQLKAVVADLNDDGKPDLAYSQYGVQTPLSWLIGDGKGNFSASSGLSGASFEGGGIQATISALPANSDVIVQDAGSGFLYDLQNQGSASFAASALPSLSTQLFNYAAGVDVDGNRNLYSSGHGMFSVWSNLGQPSTYLHFDEKTPSTVNSFAVNDVDGDGRLDFIGNFTDYSYSVLTQEVSIAKGGLDGKLLVPQLLSIHDSGTVGLQISNIQVSGPFSQTNNCSAVQQISYYHECSVSVSYIPTQAGTETGTLTITDNSYNSPHAIPLSGTGVATTTTQLSYQPQTVYAGENITITAHVSPPNSSGSVQFQSSWNVPPSHAIQLVTDTEPLIAGVASTTLQNVVTGNYSLSASYSGNTAYFKSDAAPLSLTVLPKVQPTFSLGRMASQIYSGVAIPFTANLPPDATGQVTFFDGTKAISGAVPVNNGMATATITGLTVGAHSISATYSGDYHYLTTQTSTFALTILSGVVPIRPARPSRPGSSTGESENVPAANHVAVLAKNVASRTTNEAQSVSRGKTKAEAASQTQIQVVAGNTTGAIGLPVGCVAQPYKVAMKTPGTSPSSWSFSSSDWTNAIEFDRDTGSFSGTPDHTGTFTGTVWVTGGSNEMRAIPVSLTIQDCK